MDLTTESRRLQRSDKLKSPPKTADEKWSNCYNILRFSEVILLLVGKFMQVKTVSPTPNQVPAGSSKPLPRHINTLEVPTVTVETNVMPTVEEQFNGGSNRGSDPDALRYDPIAIAQNYSKRPLQVLMRRLGIVWPFLLFALRIWWDNKTGKKQQNQRKNADEYLRTLSF